MRGEKLSYSPRRPYLMGNQSVGNFYKAPARFLKELADRESEFEKPYLDEDYRKMHFDFPVPDWPIMPPLGPGPELPIPGPSPGLSLCAITCYVPGGGDCSEPIWCHPSIWCGTDMSCNLCSWIVSGATLGYSWKHIVDEVPSKTRGIEIWIDENLLTEGKALIHAQMQDPCGNLCGKDLEVTCKECPPDIVISWDSDNSAETIGRNAAVDVYVKDGLGDYTWHVAGTGFSIPETTTGVHNVLSADNTACGTATITVTDVCGDTTTGYVRCTAASDWVLKAPYDTCVISGAASYLVGAYVFEYIAGNKRQLESIIRAAGATGDCVTDAAFCDGYCDTDTCLAPPFVEPGIYGDITPNCMDHPETGSISCFCGELNLRYYEWECI